MLRGHPAGGAYGGTRPPAPLRRGSIERHVSCGPAHPLALLPRLQQELRRGGTGLVGGAQGRHRGRHWRLHPPGLGRRAGRVARAGRTRPAPPSPRPPVEAEADHPGQLRPPGALPALGRDLHHLQARRGDQEGPPPYICTHIRGGGRDHRRPGQGREPGIRRPSHPRPRLASPAGDHAERGAGVLPGARAHLDAVVRRSGIQIGVRRGSRLLPRSRRPCLRGRDRALL